MTMSNVQCPMTTVLAALVLAFPPTSAAQTSLSIYRDGRVVVRRTLPHALQQGRNALTLRLAGLDPATVVSTDTAGALPTPTVRYPSAAPDALARGGGLAPPLLRVRSATSK